LFPDGNGRHLTAPEFVELKRKQEDGNKREEEAKKKRKEARVSKKALKVQFDKQWKAEKAAHEVAVTSGKSIIFWRCLVRKWDFRE